eukprot:COSAG01_NODE_12394_length_1747_cov_1.827168_2_plen_108_part_00
MPTGLRMDAGSTDRAIATDPRALVTPSGKRKRSEVGSQEQGTGPQETDADAETQRGDGDHVHWRELEAETQGSDASQQADPGSMVVEIGSQPGDGVASVAEGWQQQR